MVTRFTTPFLYDPAAGNLLLEYQYTSDNGESLRWDAVTGSPTSRLLLGNGFATAPTGSFIPANVNQFTFAAQALATIRASQVEVCWNSQSNVTYQVQYRSDLTSNLWTSLVDCVRSVGSTSCISDNVVVGEPQRFYRVSLNNCIP